MGQHTRVNPQKKVPSVSTSTEEPGEFEKNIGRLISKMELLISRLEKKSLSFQQIARDLQRNQEDSADATRAKAFIDGLVNTLSNYNKLLSMPVSNKEDRLEQLYSIDAVIRERIIRDHEKEIIQPTHKHDREYVREQRNFIRQHQTFIGKLLQPLADFIEKHFDSFVLQTKSIKASKELRAMIQNLQPKESEEDSKLGDQGTSTLSI